MQYVSKSTVSNFSFKCKFLQASISSMFLLESGAYYLGGGRESMLFVNNLDNDEGLSIQKEKS